MDFDPVGTVMAWIGIYGLFGLFAAAVIERVAPVIPSYGLLLAVGISASDGAWPLLAALLATSAGSLLGCAACFYGVRGLGERRSMRVLVATSRFFGMSVERMDGRIASFGRNQTALAFSLQLVPTIRLFAPVFAALLRGNAHRFLTASAAGILAWNGLFIGIGFHASHKIETTNTTVLATAALVCVLVVEAAAFWIVRWIQSRHTSGRAICQTS